MGVFAAAWILVGVLILLIVANALFVAVEFSYLTVNRNAVRARVEQGDRTAELLDKALSRTSTNLSGAQLGITVSSLIAGFLTGPSVGVLLDAAVGSTRIPEPVATIIGTTVAFLVVTICQMVFGELVPKNWAIAEPAKVAGLVVRPQNIFMVIFGWLVWLLNSAANRILRALGFEPQEELANARTAEELAAVVAHSGAQGTLDQATAELLARSIDFGNRRAADVMVPRPRVTFVEDETVADLLDLTARTGFSRFPVIGDGVDDIAGIVHFKDALAVARAERETTPARTLVRDLPVVAESMSLDPLLRELRQPGLQIALVVDEYGGTAGIVTLEDLIEEIVGEIDDEHDQAKTQFRRRSDGSIVVAGLLRPDELGDIVDLVLPEGTETDTLGGLISEHVDRLPEVGDQVILDATDYAHRDDDSLPIHARISLTVVKMDAHRVERVVVRRLDEPADDPDEEPVHYDTAPPEAEEPGDIDTSLRADE